MRTTIDRTGRLVVPREIRERLRLAGGEAVEVEEHDGVIEITVAPIEVEIVATADGPVAVAGPDTPALTDEVVRDTLERVRR